MMMIMFQVTTPPLTTMTEAPPGTAPQGAGRPVRGQGVAEPRGGAPEEARGAEHR